MSKQLVRLEIVAPSGKGQIELDQPAPESRFTWEGEVAPGQGIPALLEELAKSHPEIIEKVYDQAAGKVRSSYMVSLNGRLLSTEQLSRWLLQAGEQLQIFPVPFGG